MNIKKILVAVFALSTTIAFAQVPVKDFSL